MTPQRRRKIRLLVVPNITGEQLEAMSDVELQAAIYEFGDRLVAAMKDGHREVGQAWMHAMHHAIRVRDERHGDERHAEFERRLYERSLEPAPWTDEFHPQSEEATP